MPLGIDFGRILVDFGCQNRAKLSSKWDQNPMFTSKGVFSKKCIFPKGKTMFFEIQWVEVGSKNQSKIDSENESKNDAGKK